MQAMNKIKDKIKFIYKIKTLTLLKPVTGL